MTRSKLRTQIFGILLLIVLRSLPMNAQILIGSTAADTVTVAENLHVPWEILWGPDNRVWFTERNGYVSRLDPATRNVERLLRIPDVYEYSESGLLGMALHPDFTNSPFVYLVYTYLSGSSIVEKLVRYSFTGDTLVNPAVIMDNIAGNGNHNGSRIIFMPDGKLLFSTGDAQNSGLSQANGELPGKILRINPDGTVPSDNPFPGNPVWTKGHRNPQGLVLGSNGKLYSSEHGPNSDDEINIIEKGRNYGWPNVIGKCNTPAEITFCTDSAVVEPVKTWTPTLAVAGIDYYSHPAMPELNNSILLTNLKEADLRVLKLNPDGTQIVSEIVCLNNIFGRLRDLCVSPGGKIYIATSNHDGRGFPSSTDDRIIEIAPQTLAIHPAAKKDTPSFFPNPFSALAVLDLPSPETWKLTLCDITGREIRPAVSHKGNSLILHRENLLPGIYLYRLESGEGSIVRGKIRVE